MTSRLDDRIRKMMQEVVDQSPPAPSLPTGPPPQLEPRRHLRNWAAALGAAAAVFILVGGVAWLLGQTETGVIDEPGITTTAATPLPPAPTTTIAAAPDIDPGPGDPVLPGGAGTVTTFGVEDGLPSTFAWNVSATADGSVWASVVLGGSYGGSARDCPWAMVRYDGSGWTTLELAGDGSSPPSTIEYCGTTPFVGATSDDTLWFDEPLWITGYRSTPPHVHEALWSLRDGTWTAHESVDVHPYAPLWIGRDGTVWVTTEDGLPGGSLARFSDGVWQEFNVSDTNLPALIGQRLAPDGANVYDNFDRSCMSGGVDSRGTLWLTGSAPALASYDGVTWPVGNDPSEDWAGWCIPAVGPPAFGPDGAIWYASEGGLIRWHDDVRTEWTIADTWTSDAPIRSFGYAQDIAVGPDGRVWIPADDQLVAFDPLQESWMVVPAEVGLPPFGDLTSIAVDPAGSVWLAGSAGITRYEPGTAATTVESTGNSADLAALDWIMTPLPTDRIPADFATTLEGAGADGIYALPDGSLFATGHATADPGMQMPLIWRSKDGSTWEPISIGSRDGSFWLEGMAASGTEYLAKGISDDGSGRQDAYRREYWSSDNGIDWVLVDTTQTDGSEPPELDAIFSEENKGWPFAWSRGTDLAGVFGPTAAPHAVLVLDNRIIVVGNRDGWVDPAVWIADLPAE